MSDDSKQPSKPIQEVPPPSRKPREETVPFNKPPADPQRDRIGKSLTEKPKK
jgi:hypothetical protein